METLVTIIAIPFKTFKDKIKIVKQYEKVAKVEIIDNIIYIKKYAKRWEIKVFMI